MANMSTVQIDIFGQSFTINTLLEKVEYYKEIAATIDEMMRSDAKKMDIVTDVKVAVKVAFLLGVENIALKEVLASSEELVDKISKKFYEDNDGNGL